MPPIMAKMELDWVLGVVVVLVVVCVAPDALLAANKKPSCKPNVLWKSVEATSPFLSVVWSITPQAQVSPAPAEFRNDVLASAPVALVLFKKFTRTSGMVKLVLKTLALYFLGDPAVPLPAVS